MNGSRTLARLALGASALAATALLVHVQRPSAQPGRATPPPPPSVVGEPVTGPRVAAPPLPTPRDFVSGLDLECYDTPGTSRGDVLTLTHLNPVLVALGLPPHVVEMKELVHSCFPVMKNNTVPPAWQFLRHASFGCYRIESRALEAPVPLALSHLNPLFAHLPRHLVALTKPDTLCVPIQMDNDPPPEGIIDLVRYLDLECWEVEADDHPAFGVHVAHISPQLEIRIPAHNLHVQPQNRRLCVPVRKNDQHIPAEALNIIRWVDLERFTGGFTVNIPVNLRLQHLNPLFASWPDAPLQLVTSRWFMAPVAKNEELPPAQ